MAEFGTQRNTHCLAQLMKSRMRILALPEKLFVLNKARRSTDFDSTSADLALSSLFDDT